MYYTGFEKIVKLRRVYYLMIDQIGEIFERVEQCGRVVLWRV